MGKIIPFFTDIKGTWLKDLSSLREELISSHNHPKESLQTPIVQEWGMDV